MGCVRVWPERPEWLGRRLTLQITSKGKRGVAFAELPRKPKLLASSATLSLLHTGQTDFARNLASKIRPSSPRDVMVRL